MKGYLKKPGRSTDTARARSLAVLPRHKTGVDCSTVTCVMTQLNQLCSQQGPAAQTHWGPLVYVPAACDGRGWSCDGHVTRLIR